jgi:hypothetical protein
MFDVVVYLSSLPRIADRNRKVEVLEAFAAGARSQGASVLIQTQHQVVDCKLAVILGWVGTKIRGPHIQLRRDVIDHQRKTGNHVMPIDSSCFKFVDQDSVFLRYSLDGVFYNKDIYANADSDDTKWCEIQHKFGLELQPWRTQGEHVLVCLQRDGGWSMKGIDMSEWTYRTVHQLRDLTQRPILVRPHPKYRMDLSGLSGIPNVKQSMDGSKLQQDLKGAWAAVFCNSSSSVAAVLAGIPVFADDDDCVAWAVANHDLQQIEDPAMPDREQWLHDLCAAHWTDHDSITGEIYKKFLPFIEDAPSSAIGHLGESELTIT